MLISAKFNSFNVLDSLKHLSESELQEYYLKNCNSAAVAMMHVEGDFNLSNVVRTANSFGFKEVFYVGGKKQWDRRGAVGTHHYIPLKFMKTVDEFFTEINGKYVPVALENNTASGKIHNLYSFQWPLNPVIVCGEERGGIPAEVLDRINYFVEIPSMGTVRSLNVGTAAGIAMSHYINQSYK